jgi:protein-S-isoprenylcysteine O-methyltransferase Ste14
MNFKIASLIGFGSAVAGLCYLVIKHYIFSGNPVAITIQLCAVGLMIWARITLGVRSFHATANTTKGELVTKGPYRWLRHPIYAAVIYFSVACIISYPFMETIGAVILIIAGLFVRMISEERFLFAAYSEYAAYCKRAKRVVPFLF